MWYELNAQKRSIICTYGSRECLFPRISIMASSSNSSGPESSSSSSNCPSDTEVLLLKVLLTSLLCQKWKGNLNLALKGKGQQPHGHCNLKSVTLAQWVSEFCDALLTVSMGKLFWTTIREELGLQRSVIQTYIKSGRPADVKQRLEPKEAQEKDIALTLSYTGRVRCRPILK